MQVKSIAECFTLEHSAIFLTCIKGLYISLESIFLVFFECPLKTGFTVVHTLNKVPYESMCAYLVEYGSLIFDNGNILSSYCNNMLLIS